MKQASEKTRRILFGSGDILGGGAFTLLSLLYLNFLTNAQHMSPGLAGLLLLVGKFFDAGIDPFLGYLTDHTRSRFGRRRLYFLLGIGPVFLSFILLWTGFGISTQAGKFVYFLVVYCLFCGSASLVSVPYNALLPEIAPGYDQRTSYMSTRMIFSVCSSILAGVAPMIIVNRFPDVKTGYLVMAAIFGALYALPWILVFLGTHGTDTPLGARLPEKPAERDPFFAPIAGIFRNRTFRYYIFMFLSGMAAVDLLLSLLIYYVTSVLDRSREFPLVTGITIIFQLIGTQIWAAVARKTHKTMPIKIGALIWAAGMGVCLLITRDSPPALLYIAAALIGIGGISCNQVPWSVVGDVVDVGELLTGKRQEGIYSGFVTFIRQSANGLMLGFSGLLLQLAGYAVPSEAGETVVQNAAAIRSIRLLFVFTPLVLLLVALLLAWLYPLSRKRFAAMRTARDFLAAGKPLPEELKDDIRAITGLAEEKLWGRG